MNAILKSVWKQEINANIANMSWFVWQVIKQNNWNVFGRAEENRRWNTSIEEEFMRKFHNKRQIFNLVAFEKALKSSSKSDEK
jgi:hypothetical protein